MGIRVVVLFVLFIICAIVLTIYMKKTEEFANYISPSVKFFTECFYKGEVSNKLHIGKYSTTQMIENGVSSKLKSVKFNGKLQVRLYPLDYFKGTPLVFRSSKSCPQINFDVKSIIILNRKYKKHESQLSLIPSSSMTSTATLQPEIPQKSIEIPSISISSASNNTGYVILKHVLPQNIKLPIISKYPAKDKPDIDYNWEPVPSNT